MADTPWMNLAEASEYIKRSPSYTRGQVKESRLQAKKSGGDLFFHLDWLDAYMESLPDA